MSLPGLRPDFKATFEAVFTNISGNILTLVNDALRAEALSGQTFRTYDLFICRNQTKFILSTGKNFVIHLHIFKMAI